MDVECSMNRIVKSRKVMLSIRVLEVECPKLLASHSTLTTT